MDENRATILVVDDEAVNRLLVGKILKARGLDSVEAGSVRDAINILNQQRVDAVLLDIHMPEVNGFQLLKLMKSKPEWDSIPVAVLSVETNRDIIVACLKAGALDYILKPFQPENFEKRLLACLAASPHLEQQPPKSCGRILIVDDDRAGSLMLAKILKDEGYEVTCVSGGKEALAPLQDHRIDLILLDLNMPGWDGFQLLDLFKSDPEVGKIPIVVITGDDDPRSARRCLALGAADYLIKPVDPHLLRSRVNACFQAAAE